MEKRYSPLAFANEFISLSHPTGVEHMKLQKLVYISYGWWLSAHEQPILSEQPEVWKHGPVFPTLYKILRSHGFAPITTVQNALFNRPADRVNNEDAETLDLLDWVWKRYRHMSSFALSDLTHQNGSPWQITVERHDYRVPHHTIIPADVIRDHYKKLAGGLVA